MLAPNQKRQQPPRLLPTTNQEIWSRFDLSRRACPAGAGTPFLLPLLLLQFPRYRGIRVSCF